MILKEIWALMLNNRAKKDSEKVLESLEIKRGYVIGDIGSGGGYFAAQFSKRTGEDGKVFAVDNDKDLLLYVDKAMKKKHIYNVETVIVQEDECPLPKQSCDLIFMRNVFHHIEDPGSYFTNLKESLKPHGRLAIVEWLPDMGGIYVSRAGHCTSEKTIQNILYQAGFEQLKSFNFLKVQSFKIFKKSIRKSVIRE